MALNAKDLTIARVNPARASEDPPSNTVANDWQFLCGAESNDITIANRFNQRMKLVDCQDRSTEVVDEFRRTGRSLSASISGTLENSAAGRWLIETATSASGIITDARIMVPGMMYVRCNLVINNFRVTGSDLEGNVTFSADIVSSGAITITAIALP
jgi:hypothetical protein